jgi:pantetheine-phosphate adenylyltransferase
MPDQRVAIYPGTFDPVTNGHLDIIGRGARLVDLLIVAVAVNAGKGPLFDLDARVALLEEEIRHLPADSAARPSAWLSTVRMARSSSAIRTVRGSVIRRSPANPPGAPAWKV